MDQEFAAFLSYSHRDARWAGWLHRAIETYTVPPHLAGKAGAHGPIPRRLRPIFRDRDELAAASDLNERIEAALARSRALIVLCSPAAARSRWTDQEIRTFKRLYPDRPVLAVIVAGEPYAGAIPGREEQEAFPPSLRYRVDADGALSDEPAEPLAADLRPEADGRRLGKLKVIAGMLGVGLDDLVRRDSARRHRRLGWFAAVSLCGMAGALALAGYAFNQRAEAVRQREQADGLIEYMLTDLRKKLEPVGRLDVLDSVGERALRYYRAQPLSVLDADALGRRARALLLVGEVAEQRGNAPRAQKAFREAARATGELLQRHPDDWQRVYDHAQSVYWIGYMAGELGDDGERLRQFRLYAALGQRLLALCPDDRRSHLEAAYGESNLGTAYRKAQRFDEALAAISRAQAQFAALIPRDREAAQSIAETHASTATILYQLGRNAEAIVARDRQLAILRAPPFAARDRDVQRDIGYALRMQGVTYLALGDLPRSQALLAEATLTWQQLIALDPSNQEWGEALATTRISNAMTGLAARHRQEARTLAAQAVATIVPLHRAQPGDDEVTIRLLGGWTAQVLAGDRAAIAPLRVLVDDMQRRSGPSLPVEDHASLAGALLALSGAHDRAHAGQARADLLTARDLLRDAPQRNSVVDALKSTIAYRLSGQINTGKPSPLIVAYQGYSPH